MQDDNLPTHAEDGRCIDGLIKLTNDSDVIVRDGAQFELGSQTEQDSFAIREALFARLSDVDAIVRGEAVVGLAKRQDVGEATAAMKGLSATDKNELLLYWEDFERPAENPVTGEKVIAQRRQVRHDLELPMKDEYSAFLQDRIVGKDAQL